MRALPPTCTGTAASVRSVRGRAERMLCPQTRPRDRGGRARLLRHEEHRADIHSRRAPQVHSPITDDRYSCIVRKLLPS
jgi:hypothetical protein